jgi:nucleoside-diphosphate-sugar epimerase
VIPLFIDALMHSRPPTVHGDGLQSRDFTFIDDVIAANLAAAASPPGQCTGKAYNIADGTSHSLLDLLEVLGKILDVRTQPSFAPSRAGDVRMSQADPSAAIHDLGFRCATDLEDGLRATVAWFVRRDP